ncbi:Energy-coupling factor transporter transmembrane protein EcfT [Pseudomonas syringae pv. actinidiae]|nr:Energy-coupling factor transporter transmembrane protein EcfT [Pseudomonas syringae pv. actinidiae]
MCNQISSPMAGGSDRDESVYINPVVLLIPLTGAALFHDATPGYFGK